MRKLLASIFTAFALSFAGVASAQLCKGIGQCQGQGQLQGQQQGQLQGQQQGMQQGQIGINKNYNSDYNYNKNYSSNKNYNSAYSKATAIQGQLQGNKQGVKIKTDASGNAVAAFAPSISSRSTTNCITTYSASGGSGGVTSIWSLGLSLPIRDEDCVQEQAVRTGFESNIPEAQQLALKLYKVQINSIMDDQETLKVSSVLDADGNVQKVMYSDDLEAFVPIEKHPAYQRAAAVAFTEMMFQAGYKPNVSAIGGSGFQRVSFPLGDQNYTMNMDEDLIESVLQDIDDDNAFKFTPRDEADGN